MADELIDLRSVNWSQGMFLTPDHFLRQERYVDSLLLWLVRYGLRTSGLIGGGPRVDVAERGAAAFDPVVEIDETAEALKVTVVQCRGLTPGGAVVDIEPGAPIHAVFPKRDLEGVTDVGVYVVARPHAKEPDERLSDPINPGVAVGRRYSYRLQYDIHAQEADWSVLLTRLRRAQKGGQFERIPGFIPPCAFMSSHSSLMDNFRQLTDTVAGLADRYSRLHRAIVEFVALARTRSLGIESDLETLEFVNRMVLTLEDGAYRLLDPLQSPSQFFQELARLVRSAALFLSLSPPTREYFRLLGDIGEVEFVSMLEQEVLALEGGRRWAMHDDLNLEAQRARRALDRLDRLEQALEGKYLDYRVSPTLESINFVFDRTSGDPVLYKTVSKPSRPQAMGQELTFVFAPLRLEAREVYRVVLVGDREAHFAQGDRLNAELRINPGEGYAHAPEYLSAGFEVDSQRNFALDFKAPEDVVTLNDIRVSVRSAQPIRSAILYVRARLQSSSKAVYQTPVPQVVDQRPPRPAPSPVPPSPRPPEKPTPDGRSSPQRKTRLS